MKKLALVTAGIFLLAPALANASQPVQASQKAPAPGPAPTPPAQAASQSDEPLSKPAAPATAKVGQADATCVTSGKPSSSDDKASHPSAKVGKDTGELPPARKKPSSEASCASQPDR